jgi:endonuclease-8
VPEGDVVLRTARRLDAALAGRRLLTAQLRWPTAAGVELAGVTVLGTHTVGKHLLSRFDDGRTLHTHLRMEGVWAVRRTAAGARPGRDVRVALVGPEWTCLGLRLGMVDVVRTRDERTLVGHLGPDVLASGWDRAAAAAAVHAQGARPVGAALLDQRVVAGLGTIYMAETLWAHGVSPWAPAGSVPDPGALLDTARRLMLRSVAARTPTATGDERQGRQSNVHARAGLPCPRCGTTIRVDLVGEPTTARPAFYCPACQPPAEPGGQAIG